MTTPNMLLSLPTVSVTVGPEWANEVNAAFNVIDSHDHSSDKGSRITPAGLQINDSLDINNQIFFNFKALNFQQQSAALTGVSNANSLYSLNGDLYFTSGAGSSIQITDGGSIVTTPASASTFEVVQISSNTTIANSDTFVYLIVDTTASRTITLPLSSGVAGGRIYIVKDASGNSESNPITVQIQGSDTIDGQSSQELTTNYGSWTIVGDGVLSWYIS